MYFRYKNQNESTYNAREKCGLKCSGMKRIQGWNVCKLKLIGKGCKKRKMLGRTIVNQHG
jgi:hypothetical protein